MPQFLTQEKDIIAWLTQMQVIGAKSNVVEYSISSKGVVDIVGRVDLSHKNLTHIPIQFGNIEGDFNISYNQLTSLQGAPQTVMLGFNCSFNALTNLVGGPSVVKKDYICSYNKLISLEGVASNMNRLDASYNHIVSLGHMPTFIGDDCVLSYNPIQEIVEIHTQIGGFLMLDKTDIMNVAWLKATLINTQAMSLGLGFLNKPDIHAHFNQQINNSTDNEYYRERYFTHALQNRQDLFVQLEVLEEKEKLENNIQALDKHKNKIKV